MFRKAPPVNSTGQFRLGDCWIGWDSVVRTRVFSLAVWFQRERFELCWLLISWSKLFRSMVLVENDVEGEI